MKRIIDDQLLDELRKAGDPVADDLAAQYLGHGRNPADLFRVVVGHPGASKGGTDGDPLGGEVNSLTDPNVAAWLDQRPELPEWAVPERLERGSHFYSAHGIPLGIGLFLASLPLAYASHDGVQVLALTARLETNARRRILETAQFVIDVTKPRALVPGGQGYETARHVRLVHAGVRQLITNDTRIPLTDDPSVWPRWDPAWGMPVNQEHLLGAMISYSSSLLKVLDKFHARYNPDAAEDYCLLWSTVGWLLGIDESILPLTRADLDRLEPIIRARNEKASAAGVELTKALLETVRSFAKMPVLKNAYWPGSTTIPVAITRMLIGDDTADLLELPKSKWASRFVHAARPPKHRISLGLARFRVLRLMVRRVVRTIFKGFVYTTREGGRPAFTIPTSLGFDEPSTSRLGVAARKVREALPAKPYVRKR